MKVVDFIIAGAPKCGTTALWHFLNQHPDIFLSSNKEPKFYTAIQGTLIHNSFGTGPRLSGTFKNGISWYQKLFEEAKPNQLKGEASTLYFCNEDSAQLIHDGNQDIKLIFMLRDPVKRMYSHYWQEYKLGYDFPSFEEMVKTNHPRLLFYKNVSSYRENLSRYLNLFKNENILILIQEEFEENPQKGFQEVLNFLGVSIKLDIDLSKKHNIQRTPKNRKIAKFLSVLRNSKFKKFVPEGVNKIFGKLNKRIALFNSKKFEYPKLSHELYLQLKSEFSQDEEFVSQLLKRDIEHWRIN